MQSYMDDSYPEMELFRLALTGSGSQREELEDNKFRARAHIVGCVQSLHSISDILAHVIYYAFDLGLAKKDRDISLGKVQRWLGANQNFKKIKEYLDLLVNHDDYDYLCALANYSKHRSIVSLSLNFNLRRSGSEMKELVFPSFTYDEQCFRARSVNDFLESEFNRETRLVFEIGNAINQLLR